MKAALNSHRPKSTTFPQSALHALLNNHGSPSSEVRSPSQARFLAHNSFASRSHDHPHPQNEGSDTASSLIFL